MALFKEGYAGYGSMVIGGAIPSMIDAGMIRISNVPAASEVDTSKTAESANTEPARPAYVGPSVTREEIMHRFAPLTGVTDFVEGTTFIDPDTGKTAVDKRGSVVFRTTRWKGDVATPLFRPQEKVSTEVIGREKNGELIFKSTRTRNY